MNVKGAYYIPQYPTRMVVVTENNIVCSVNDAPIRELKESDLEPIKVYNDEPSYRSNILTPKREIFPQTYAWYGLNKVS